MLFCVLILHQNNLSAEDGIKEVRRLVILGKQLLVECANFLGHNLMRVHGFAHLLPSVP